MSLKQGIKEDLQTERKEYGDYNNLVVVATGVGKTVIILFRLTDKCDL